MPDTDPTADPTHGHDRDTDHTHDTDATNSAHDQPRELATLVDDSRDTARHTICPARADATELLTT